jgi:hypothetical protein
MIPPTSSSESHATLNILAYLVGIPSHNPRRYETTDGLDNPACTNKDRASMAARALDEFRTSCGMIEDVETAAADLICDLLHLVHAENCDPLHAILNGIQSFLCEAGHLSPPNPTKG